MSCTEQSVSRSAASKRCSGNRKECRQHTAGDDARREVAHES
jgi:hypothetical protein